MLLFFILPNVFLGWLCNTAAWACSQEAGRETFFGRSSSIQPNSGILIERPLPANPNGKDQQNMRLVNSLQREKILNYFCSNTFGKVKNFTAFLLTSKLCKMSIKLGCFILFQSTSTKTQQPKAVFLVMCDPSMNEV